MADKINGLNYSSESNIPREQICGIDISFEGVRRTIDYSVVKNIFEPNFYCGENSFTGEVYCNSNVYLNGKNEVVIAMSNGDGANHSSSKIIINKEWEIIFVKYPYSIKTDE